MVSGVGKKKTRTKVRGQRWLSSLWDPTATGWCLTRPMCTKMPPLQLQTRFDPFRPPNLTVCPLRFISRLPTCLEKGWPSSENRGKKNNTAVIKSNQSSASQYENTSVWLEGVTHRVNNETTNELVCYSPSCGEIPHTGQQANISFTYCCCNSLITGSRKRVLLLGVSFSHSLFNQDYPASTSWPNVHFHRVQDTQKNMQSPNKILTTGIGIPLLTLWWWQIPSEAPAVVCQDWFSVRRMLAGRCRALN